MPSAAGSQPPADAPVFLRPSWALLCCHLCLSAAPLPPAPRPSVAASAAVDWAAGAGRDLALQPSGPGSGRVAAV